PDFALVKFKKLAGGGYFKIANQSLEPALTNLGYSPEQRRAILTYVLGTLSLNDAPYINSESLQNKGFTPDDVAKIERALPGVFELSFAFNAWSLGEETLGRAGITLADASKPGFDLLAALGYSRAQIEAANEHICGTMTVEGAPFLADEHLPVFDCANRCGKKGTRFIHHLGHVKMMSAAQSFLSGAISKTINMPHEATIDDVTDAYHESWRHGLKAMALYRDGSKLSQPLSTKSDVGVVEGSEAEIEHEALIQQRIDEAVATAVAQARLDFESGKHSSVGQPVVAQAQPVSTQSPPSRQRLPAKRSGFTQEARVAGHKVFLRTGEYEDGSLGEIFIDMHKEGAAFRSMINCFAIAISKGLQYGVPLDEFVDTFTFTRFDPQGMVTGHPNIKMATSIIDYVFRVLGLEYLDRTDLVQVQNRPIDQTGEDRDLFGAGDDDQHGATQTATDSSSSEAPVARAAVTSTTAVQPEAAATSTKRHSNGRHSGVDGEAAAAAAPANSATAVMQQMVPLNMLDAHLSEMMGDAPFCDVCGHITVRNGACYKCLNCGNSLGCS
ncbi:MAG: vitamin B12-dependent ribonucleotide reductase, partial [Chloroflexota bacterium]|nr:vitamin B12-dependent ribonucleotide reductase [Chloroflexota bacterium]